MLLMIETMARFLFCAITMTIKKPFERSLLWRLSAVPTLFSFLITSAAPSSLFAEQPFANRSSRAAWDQPSTDPFSVQIPADFGIIRERFLGTEPRQLVIHIQDAHTSADAQQNIRRMVDHLERSNGLKLVTFEGVEGELDPFMLRAFPDRKLLAKILGHYVRRGELSGVDLAAALNHRESRYLGIENQVVYDAGVATFLDAEKASEEALHQFGRIENELEALQREFYTPELRQVAEKIRRFEQGKIELSELLVFLKSFSDSSEGSLLNRFFEISSEAVPRMSNKTITVGSPKVGADTQVRPQRKRVDTQVDPYQKMPGASPHNDERAEGSLDALNQVDAGQILLELRSWAAAIKRELFTSDAQIEIDQMDSALGLLKDLAALKLSPEQLGTYLSNKGLYGPDRFRKFFARFDRALDISFDVSAALLFYRNALLRDRILSDRIITLVSDKKSSAAVFVSGGFHTSGVTERLRAEGVSYVVISPAMHDLNRESRYLNVMKGKISYSDLFEKNIKGEVDLFSAFTRDVTEHLARGLAEEGRLPEDFKRWRDEIVRRLIQSGDATDVHRYTRFIDELVKGRRKKAGSEPNAERITREVERLLWGFSQKAFSSYKNRLRGEFDRLMQNISSLYERRELTYEKFSGILGVKSAGIIASAGHPMKPGFRALSGSYRGLRFEKMIAEFETPASLPEPLPSGFGAEEPPADELLFSPQSVLKLLREDSVLTPFVSDSPMDFRGWPVLGIGSHGREVFASKREKSIFYKVSGSELDGIHETLGEVKALVKIREDMKTRDGIPEILKLGITDDVRLWVKMKGISNGLDLDEAIRIYGFTLLDTIDIFIQTARVLDQIHRAGWVHNDIKGSNIVVNAAKQVLVADFGIAVPEGTKSNAGTTIYFTSSDKKRKRDSDVYSLSVTLWITLRSHFLDLAACGNSGLEKLVDGMGRDNRDRRFPNDMPGVIDALERVKKYFQDHPTAGFGMVGVDDLFRKLDEFGVRGELQDEVWRSLFEQLGESGAHEVIYKIVPHLNSRAIQDLDSNRRGSLGWALVEYEKNTAPRRGRAWELPGLAKEGLLDPGWVDPEVWATVSEKWASQTWQGLGRISGYGPRIDDPVLRRSFISWLASERLLNELPPVEKAVWEFDFDPALSEPARAKQLLLETLRYTDIFRALTHRLGVEPAPINDLRSMQEAVEAWANLSENTLEEWAHAVMTAIADSDIRPSREIHVYRHLPIPLRLKLIELESKKPAQTSKLDLIVGSTSGFIRDDQMIYPPEQIREELSALFEQAAVYAESIPSPELRNYLFVQARWLLLRALDQFGDSGLAYVLRGPDGPVPAFSEYSEIWERERPVWRNLPGFKAFLQGGIQKGNLESVRTYLLVADGQELRQLDWTGKESLVVQAYLENHFNSILIQHTDRILSVTRGKEVEHFIEENLVALADKLKAAQGKKTKFSTVTWRTLRVFLRRMGLKLSRRDMTKLVSDTGFYVMSSDSRIYFHTLSILESGYRGSDEEDRASAQYLTRSPSTALIKYGWTMGEASAIVGAKTAGRPALHEYDYHLMNLQADWYGDPSRRALKSRHDSSTGKRVYEYPYREIDSNVALAIKSKHPLNGVFKKRSLVITNRTSKELITELSRAQTVERRAKAKLLAAFRHFNQAWRFRQTRFKAVESMQSALRELKENAGLRAGYFQAVYGPLATIFEGYGIKSGDDAKAKLEKAMTLKAILPGVTLNIRRNDQSPIGFWTDFLERESSWRAITGFGAVGVVHGERGEGEKHFEETIELIEAAKDPFFSQLKEAFRGGVFRGYSVIDFHDLDGGIAFYLDFENGMLVVDWSEAKSTEDRWGKQDIPLLYHGKPIYKFARAPGAVFPYDEVFVRVSKNEHVPILKFIDQTITNTNALSVEAKQLYRRSVKSLSNLFDSLETEGVLENDAAAVHSSVIEPYERRVSFHFAKARQGLRMDTETSVDVPEGTVSDERWHTHPNRDSLISPVDVEDWPGEVPLAIATELSDGTGLAENEAFHVGLFYPKTSSAREDALRELQQEGKDAWYNRSIPEKYLYMRDVILRSDTGEDGDDKKIIQKLKWNIELFHKEARGRFVKLLVGEWQGTNKDADTEKLTKRARDLFESVAVSLTAETGGEAIFPRRMARDIAKAAVAQTILDRFVALRRLGIRPVFSKIFAELKDRLASEDVLTLAIRTATEHVYQADPRLRPPESYRELMDPFVRQSAEDEIKLIDNLLKGIAKGSRTDAETYAWYMGVQVFRSQFLLERAKQLLLTSVFEVRIETALARFDKDLLDDLSIRKDGRTPPPQGEAKDITESSDRPSIYSDKEFTVAMIVNDTLEQIKEEYRSPVQLKKRGIGDFASFLGFREIVFPAFRKFRKAEPIIYFPADLWSAAERRRKEWASHGIRPPPEETSVYSAYIPGISGPALYYDPVSINELARETGVRLSFADFFREYLSARFYDLDLMDDLSDSMFRLSQGFYLDHEIMKAELKFLEWLGGDQIKMAIANKEIELKDKQPHGYSRRIRPPSKAELNVFEDAWAGIITRLKNMLESQEAGEKESESAFEENAGMFDGNIPQTTEPVREMGLDELTGDPSPQDLGLAPSDVRFVDPHMDPSERAKLEGELFAHYDMWARLHPFKRKHLKGVFRFIMKSASGGRPAESLEKDFRPGRMFVEKIPADKEGNLEPAVLFATSKVGRTYHFLTLDRNGDVDEYATSELISPSAFRIMEPDELEKNLHPENMGDDRLYSAIRRLIQILKTPSPPGIPRRFSADEDGPAQSPRRGFGSDQLRGGGLAGFGAREYPGIKDYLRIISFPLMSSSFFSWINVLMADRRLAIMGGKTLTQTIPEVSEGGYRLGSEKSLSWVIRNLFSRLASWYTSPLLSPFGHLSTSHPDATNKRTTSRWIISSVRNRNLAGEGTRTQGSIFNHFAREVKRGLDRLSGKRWVSTQDVVYGIPALDHLKYERDGYPRTSEARGTMTNVRMNTNVFADGRFRHLHARNANTNPISRPFSEYAGFGAKWERDGKSRHGKGEKADRKVTLRGQRPRFDPARRQAIKKMMWAGAGATGLAALGTFLYRRSRSSKSGALYMSYGGHDHSQDADQAIAMLEKAYQTAPVDPKTGMKKLAIIFEGIMPFQQMQAHVSMKKPSLRSLDDEAFLEAAREDLKLLYESSMASVRSRRYEGRRVLALEVGIQKRMAPGKARFTEQILNFSIEHKLPIIIEEPDFEAWYLGQKYLAAQSATLSAFLSGDRAKFLKRSKDALELAKSSSLARDRSLNALILDLLKNDWDPKMNIFIHRGIGHYFNHDIISRGPMRTEAPAVALEKPAALSKKFKLLFGSTQAVEPEDTDLFESFLEEMLALRAALSGLSIADSYAVTRPVMERMRGVDSAKLAKDRPSDSEQKGHLLNLMNGLLDLMSSLDRRRLRDDQKIEALFEELRRRNFITKDEERYFPSAGFGVDAGEAVIREEQMAKINRAVNYIRGQFGVLGEFVSSVEFSGDGNLLALGTNQIRFAEEEGITYGKPRVYLFKFEAADMELIAELGTEARHARHEASVAQLVFSSDSRLLASLDGNGAVIVWHLRQPERTSGQFVYIPSLMKATLVNGIEIEESKNGIGIIGKSGKEVVFRRQIEGGVASSFSNTPKVLKKMLEDRRNILKTIGPKEETVKELRRFRDMLSVHDGNEDVFLPLFIAAENDGYRTGQFSMGVIRILNYYIERAERTDDFRPIRETIPIIFDAYLFYLIALLSLRIWDEGDPDENLSVVQKLLDELPRGGGQSGKKFVRYASDLLTIAASLNNDDLSPYRLLPDRVSRLKNRNSRLRFAVASAKGTGSRLRSLIVTNYLQPPLAVNLQTWKTFFEGEQGMMHRAGNNIDYELIPAALNILFPRYEEILAGDPNDPERLEIVEAILDGISADPEYFINPPEQLGNFVSDPAKKAAYEFYAYLKKNAAALLKDMRRFNPALYQYSPLGQVKVVALPFFNLYEDVLLSLTGSPFEQFSYEDRFTVGPNSEVNAQKREWVRFFDARLRAFDPSFYEMPAFRGRYSHELAELAYDETVRGLESLARVPLWQIEGLDVILTNDLKRIRPVLRSIELETDILKAFFDILYENKNVRSASESRLSYAFVHEVLDEVKKSGLDRKTHFGLRVDAAEQTVRFVVYPPGGGEEVYERSDSPKFQKMITLFENLLFRTDRRFSGEHIQYLNSNYVDTMLLALAEYLVSGAESWPFVIEFPPSHRGMYHDVGENRQDSEWELLYMMDDLIRYLRVAVHTREAGARAGFGHQGLAERWDEEFSAQIGAEIRSALGDKGRGYVEEGESRPHYGDAYYGVESWAGSLSDDKGGVVMGLAFLRAGFLFFIDEIAYSLLPPELRTKLGANVILVQKLDTSDFSDSSLQRFTVAMIAAMFHGELEGKRVFDMGSGEGILSLAALKLGAQDVVLLEHKERLLVSAKANLLLNGYAEREHFHPLLADIGSNFTVRKETLEKIKALPPSNAGVVFIVNIGPWPDYRVNNVNVIDLIRDIHEIGLFKITAFIAGGYDFTMSSHPGVVKREQKEIAGLGFVVGPVVTMHGSTETVWMATRQEALAPMGFGVKDRTSTVRFTAGERKFLTTVIGVRAAPRRPRARPPLGQPAALDQSLPPPPTDISTRGGVETGEVLPVSEAGVDKQAMEQELYDYWIQSLALAQIVSGVDLEIVERNLVQGYLITKFGERAYFQVKFDEANVIENIRRNHPTFFIEDKARAATTVYTNMRETAYREYSGEFLRVLLGWLKAKGFRYVHFNLMHENAKFFFRPLLSRWAEKGVTAYSETKYSILVDLGLLTRIENPPTHGFGSAAPILFDREAMFRDAEQILAGAIDVMQKIPASLRPRVTLDHPGRGRKRKPGALIFSKNTERLIVVADLHAAGRPNLEMILDEIDYERALKDPKTMLAILGDAVHPGGSYSIHEYGSQEANLNSLFTLLMVADLIRRFPGKVHYFPGNHDFAHVWADGKRIEEFTKGGLDQANVFENAVADEFGEENARRLFKLYEEFIRAAPLIGRFGPHVKRTADSLAVSIVHNGPSFSRLPEYSRLFEIENRRHMVDLLHRVFNPDLEDSMAEYVRLGILKEVLPDLIYERRYKDKEVYLDELRKFNSALAADIMISGHTQPTAYNAVSHGLTVIEDVLFGHVNNEQLVLDSQEKEFAYLDLSLKQPKPAELEDLVSPSSGEPGSALKIRFDIGFGAAKLLDMDEAVARVMFNEIEDGGFEDVERKLESRFAAGLAREERVFTRRLKGSRGIPFLANKLVQRRRVRDSNLLQRELGQLDINVSNDLHSDFAQLVDRLNLTLESSAFAETVPNDSFDADAKRAMAARIEKMRRKDPEAFRTAVEKVRAGIGKILNVGAGNNNAKGRKGEWANGRTGALTLGYDKDALPQTGSGLERFLEKTFGASPVSGQVHGKLHYYYTAEPTVRRADRPAPENQAANHRSINRRHRNTRRPTGARPSGGERGVISEITGGTAEAAQANYFSSLIDFHSVPDGISAGELDRHLKGKGVLVVSRADLLKEDTIRNYETGRVILYGGRAFDESHEALSILSETVDKAARVISSSNAEPVSLLAQLADYGFSFRPDGNGGQFIYVDRMAYLASLERAFAAERQASMAA